MLRSHCVHERRQLSRGGLYPCRCIARSALVPVGNDEAAQAQAAIARLRSRKRGNRPAAGAAAAGVVFLAFVVTASAQHIPRGPAGRRPWRCASRSGAIQLAGGRAVRSQQSAGTSPMATSRPATTCHRALTRRHFGAGSQARCGSARQVMTKTRSRAGCGYRHVLIQRPAQLSQRVGRPYESIAAVQVPGQGEGLSRYRAVAVAASRPPGPVGLSVISITSSWP